MYKFILIVALLLLVPLAHAGDGEGTAQLVSPRSLIAGESAQIVIEVTAGPSGIPVGGGVCLGLHHAAAWPQIQVNAPEKAGYTSYSCATPGNFEVTWYGWVPKGVFTDVQATGRSDGIHHQVAIAKVTKAPIEPGEVVTITLGANEKGIAVQRHSDPGHEFHISTDVDGDGVFKGIAVQPRKDILPAAATQLVASVPAQITPAVKFELQVRAEDAFHNLATGYNGTVTVHDEDGALLLDEVELTDGMARVALFVNTEGPRRLRLSDGVLSGRGNPCRAMMEMPELRIYWGDIHGHTSVSDGLGENAEEFFAFGRDVANLDVCALTDHGHFDWPANIAAVQKYHDPYRYVALLAQEGGARMDHLNYYYRGDTTPHIEGWPPDYGVLLNTLYEQYNDGAEPQVITGPHHFTYDRGDDRYPFGIWDDRVARFVEVYSSHGTSEYLGNPRPCQGAKDESKFMQAGLAKGLRFGVIGASDNHDSKPGRTIWGHYPGGLNAFLAPELTREDIWKALWNRHVYATSFDRIYMEFTLDGEPMGSDLERDGAVTLHYYVLGKTDNLTVHLLRNNEEIRVDETGNGLVEVTIEDTPPADDNFYYLRVVQDNGERAWSTPIWVRTPEE